MPRPVSAEHGGRGDVVERPPAPGRHHRQPDGGQGQAGPGDHAVAQPAQGPPTRERADRHGHEEPDEHQGGLGLARRVHDAGEQRHVDDDRHQRDADEQRDHQRPDQPAAHQAARHQWLGGAAVVHRVQHGQQRGHGEQRVAERAHDLGGRLGCREGEHDAAQRPAEQHGAEQVGAAEQRPGAAAPHRQGREEEHRRHQADRRGQP